ncbi:MAG: hypothetical protein ACPL6C_03440, partial [bacterium]
MKFRPKLAFILGIVNILSFALYAAQKPEPPKITMIKDRPADNGKGVIISWYHFTASPLYKYEIYRGEDLSRMKKVGVKNYQLAPKEMTLEPSNYVGDKGYYLRIRNENGEDIPTIELLKESDKTPDAEHILWVETKLVIGNAGNYEDRYAKGEFYKLKLDKEFLEKPKIVELKGYSIKDEGRKKFLVPDTKIIRLYLEKSKEATEFLEKAELIQPYDPKTNELQKEFGERITAFITDKMRRYSTIWFQDQYIDIDTLLAPSTKYYYKIRACYGYKKYVESDPVSVVTVDDLPTPPDIQGAIYDTARNEGIVLWNCVDSDIRYVELLRVKGGSEE